MIQIVNIQGIGENVVNTFAHLKGSSNLFRNFIKNIFALKNPSIRIVLYRQIYFTGVTALNKIVIIGILIGIVIIAQVINIVGSDAVLTGKILIWTVVRELGPLFVAIIIIARSCSAISSELGSMRVNKEIESLMSMGINPISYLIIPRIAGGTISAFVLTFYFQISAILGGLLLSFIFMNIPFLQHLRVIFSVLNISEITISFLKGVIFGLTISTISCYYGLGVRTSITEIPQATTKAVMYSLFLVFILNGIITLVSYYL